MIVETETAEHPEETAEKRRVWSWRFDQLVDAGYEAADAAAIAGDATIDLALARRLVADGCPAPLAARILV